MSLAIENKSSVPISCEFWGLSVICCKCLVLTYMCELGANVIW